MSLAELYRERPDWWDDAECRGMDVALFFPERGESLDAARDVCRRCEVQANCLAHALNEGEKYGVWAGTSERTRRALRRRLGLKSANGGFPPARCGTDSGYRAHRARGEEPCTSCRQARAAAKTAAKQRAAAS